VFGLALTLVEALKGSQVLTGDVQSMMSAALDKQRRPTPRNHGIDVPDAVEAVFARALALDPRERPGDVGVFWDELSKALGMKLEDRRDRRTEAGLVPREERIEAAMPPAGRHSGSPRAAVAFESHPDQSSARMRVAARANPDSSARLPVAQRTEPESSTRLAASAPELDSNARVPLARVALVSQPVLPAPPAPAAPPVPTSRPAPPTQPPSARSLDLGLPIERGLELEPAARVEIDLQNAPTAREPRRIRTGAHAPPAIVGSIAPAEPSLWPRLGLGAGLIVFAIAVTLADRALVDSGGLPLGPVSSTLVAALLVLAGLGIIVHRLMPRDRS
jgi:serine/threonine-protein kinase